MKSKIHLLQDVQPAFPSAPGLCWPVSWGSERLVLMVRRQIHVSASDVWLCQPGCQKHLCLSFSASSPRAAESKAEEEEGSHTSSLVVSCPLGAELTLWQRGIHPERPWIYTTLQLLSALETSLSLRLGRPEDSTSCTCRQFKDFGTNYIFPSGKPFTSCQIIKWTSLLTGLMCFKGWGEVRRQLEQMLRTERADKSQQPQLSNIYNTEYFR